MQSYSDMKVELGEELEQIVSILVNDVFLSLHRIEFIWLLKYKLTSVNETYGAR